MLVNAKKERIKMQRKELKRIETSIRKANREMKRLAKQRDELKLRVNKDIADDVISSCKKYIGKWIIAEGIAKKGKWVGAVFLIKPSRFVRAETLNNSVLIFMEGTILYKYPNSKFGNCFKLFGFTQGDGKYVPGKITLHMDDKYLIRIKRAATKKEIEENKDTIAVCEKYIADVTSKGNN